jgi:hypothetical protein
MGTKSVYNSKWTELGDMFINKNLKLKQLEDELETLKKLRKFDEDEKYIAAKLLLSKIDNGMWTRLKKEDSDLFNYIKSAVALAEKVR